MGLFDSLLKNVDTKKINDSLGTLAGELKKVAKAEGYMNDSTEAEFARLEALLKHDLSHDLDLNRSEISKLLASELLSRYYYQAGETEYDMRKDETLDRALQMFATPGEYARILNLTK